ncbi:MAG: beta-ketoacyl synthase chain length factor [Gammaproteobacteria bacterium]|nr:beta-ketoacyl synthase chain length factor [Gammaproteobacteria bacterium]
MDKIDSLQWSAWAPGISTKEQWQEWLADKREFDLAQKPDVSFIKPMVRRRLSSLAKMVFATAHQLLDDEQSQMPLVFASRYGEMEKTVQLLTNLSNNEGLSPTSFGLSVHNSLVGMFGLIKQWTTSSTAIGAGDRSLASGYIEAFSQSKAKKQPVLMFYYDEPLPSVYQPFADSTAEPICIGLIVDATNQLNQIIFNELLTNQSITPLDFIKNLLSKNV